MQVLKMSTTLVPVTGDVGIGALPGCPRNTTPSDDLKFSFQVSKSPVP